MGFLKRCWRGEERLWKVFWILGVVFFALVLLTGAAAIASVLVVDSTGLDVTLFLSVVFLSLFFWCKLVWKNAFNTDAKLWGYLARFSVLGLLITGFMTFSIGFDGNSDTDEDHEFHTVCEQEADAMDFTRDYGEMDLAAQVAESQKQWPLDYQVCLQRHSAWVQQCNDAFDAMYEAQGLDPKLYEAVRLRDGPACYEKHLLENKQHR